MLNKIADGEEIENRDIVIRPSEPLPLAAFGGKKRKGVVIKKGMCFKRVLHALRSKRLERQKMAIGKPYNIRSHSSGIVCNTNEPPPPK